MTGLRAITRPIAATVLSACLLSVPGIALANTVPEPPSRKEILIFVGIALIVWAAAMGLFRWLYGLFLDWNWPVDFALPVVIAGFFLSTAAIWLFVYLHLWPQTWERMVWMGLGGLAFVLLLFTLIGRARHA